MHGDAKVLAAGGVLWRGDPETPGSDREIAVVHRPKYDDWSLPKGKVDEGEQLVVTARREVCEETGAVAVCGPRVVRRTCASARPSTISSIPTGWSRVSGAPRTVRRSRDCWAR